MTKKKAILFIILALIVGLGIGMGLEAAITAGLQSGTSSGTAVEETATTDAITSGQCGDNIYWSYDADRKALDISGTGDMYDYERNTEPWQQTFLDIESVFISEGITSIGEYAFNMLTTLKYAYIGTDVTRIGKGAFLCCWSLEYVYMPPSVTELGDDAFSGTRELKRICLSDNITSFGEDCLDTESKNLELIMFCGTEEELQEVPLEYKGTADDLLIIYHNYVNGVCRVCGAEEP